MPQQNLNRRRRYRAAREGQGRPLLFLHSGEGLHPERAWLDALAKTFRVIAPCHPGWGRSSLPDWFGSVDDIAYLYLDLADKLDLKDAVLVGNSFGGWIAAEMLVRSTQRFSKLVLADPLGIKISGRNERDIADMHAMARADYMKAAWADPAKGDIDYTKLPETELAGSRSRTRGARPVRLETVHAQSPPQELAAPHHRAVAGAVGRAGQDRLEGLLRGLGEGVAQRQASKPSPKPATIRSGSSRKRLRRRLRSLRQVTQ